MYSKQAILSLLFLLQAGETVAFQSPLITSQLSSSSTPLSMNLDDSTETNGGRRAFLNRSTKAILTGLTTSFIATTTTTPSDEAQAVVYLDPAMYGDQENRLSAVDSLKEGVRRAILQKPDLAPSFYQLALLDGLSYNFKTGDYGPDGRIVNAVLESKIDSVHVANLKLAAQCIIDTKKSLKKLTSITIADAVALGGTEAVEAVGGPNLSIQVGRTDALKGATFNPDVPIDLFEGKYPISKVSDAFKKSGLTEREMTALMGALLTLEKVKTDRNPEDWKESGKAQFRQRGKIGRMNEFKKLTDEDIENAAAAEFDDDDEPGLFDDQPYIADTFGTRDQAFGKKAGDLDSKNFNKYIQDVNKSFKKPGDQSLGWIGDLLTDKSLPGTQSWVSKYSQSNLNYTKDLAIAFNSLTQLGGEFIGGKYENLLKNRPRKTLNDFD
mmetsp:Transcript_15732/g.19180  ORF Transcript_15732/g.19180 Transcript_15732/m.19180 type:complete len:439 (+) Transcript_15732:168-1484(+)